MKRLLSCSRSQRPGETREFLLLAVLRVSKNGGRHVEGDDMAAVWGDILVGLSGGDAGDTSGRVLNMSPGEGETSHLSIVISS
jgi:hypothetical protein